MPLWLLPVWVTHPHILTHLCVEPLPPVHVQAWGLMELQRGNWLAAVMLLERSARLDVACQPVLKWHVVQTAKKTVGSRKSRAGSGSARQQQEQQRSQQHA